MTFFFMCQSSWNNSAEPLDFWGFQKKCQEIVFKNLSRFNKSYGRDFFSRILNQTRNNSQVFEMP